MSLKPELQNDPLSRGYSVMTDAQVADDLNTKYRTGNVTSFSGDFMFTKTDPTEFGGLSEHKRILWISFCGKDVDPWATANEEFVKWIFGSTAQTVINLGAARTQSISRAQELGLGLVTWQQVNAVREVM